MARNFTMSIDEETRKLAGVMAEVYGFNSKADAFRESIKLAGYLQRFVKDGVMTVVDHDSNQEVNIALNWRMPRGSTDK